MSGVEGSDASVLEAAFRRFAELSALATLWIDREGKARWSNHAWIGLTGQDSAELVGWGWIGAFDPDDRAAAVALGSSLLEEQRVELHLRGDDRRRVVVKAVPISGSDVTVGSIITARPSMRSTLSDPRFEAFVANSSDVVSVHEADGSLRYVSPAITRNLGYSAEELIGMTTVDLAHPDDRERVLHILSPSLDTRSAPAAIDYRYRHKDGTWRWFEASVTNLLDDEHVRGIVVNARNVTERRNAEQALRAAEARRRAILENISELVVIIDESGVMSESPTGTQLLGYEDGFGTGQNVLQYVHPDDREHVAGVLLEKLAQPGFTEPIEVRLRHLDGSWRHCEAIGNNMLADPVVRGVIITIRDITERKQAEKLLARETEILEMVARGEPIDLVLTTLVAMIEEQAERARAAVVIADSDGQRPRLVVAPSLPDEWTIDGGLAAALSESGWVTIAGARGAPDAPTFGWSSPVIDRATDRMLGVVVLFPAERRFPLERERQVVELAGNLASVALERLEAVQELAFRATHDPLTGLPTRALFRERLAQTLAGRREGDRISAVLFLDLDRFKDINDGLGHETGDEVLRAVARRLEATLRSGDLLARFGGDEFVILANVEGPEHARMVADRLLDEIRAPVTVGDQTVEVSASIGIALPDGMADSDSLIRDADAAMYRAKERGRARSEIFDDALRSGMMARIDMESGLRRAIVRNEFILEYQPVIELGSGHVDGLEALLRWQHPDGRVVPPAEFIPLAEETGLIIPIGKWVLEQSALESARWRELRSDDPPMVMAVNLSARQLAHPGLVAEVAAAIDQAGANAEHMSLEITESVLLDDLDGTLRVLESLRELGVHIVIDDFGTGYSSLRYLKRLPVDVLKIDQGFVKGLGHDPEDTAIVRAVIELAHALDLVVVAEGVEEPAQLQELERFGCDFAQGFLFARPGPPDVVDSLLSRSLLPDIDSASAAS